MRSASILVPVLALTAAIGTLQAAAHAFLRTAEPPVGGIVAAPPGEIRLTFSEAIEPAFSVIALADGQGQPVRTGAATVDPRDPAKLVLKLPPLPGGRYQVSWHVVSLDTHRTEGQYVFLIGP